MKKRYMTAGIIKEVRYQHALTKGIRHRLSFTCYPPKPLFKRGETVHISIESLEESVKEAYGRISGEIATRPPLTAQLNKTEFADEYGRVWRFVSVTSPQYEIEASENIR